MRALRYHGWGEPPVIDDIPFPVRRSGEVLVQVRAAALAHLDLTVASGNFGMRPNLPYVGGVEGAGVVLEADDLAPGTPVMLRGGGIGLLRDGTWQEQVSVPRKAVTVLDTPLPFDVAATFFVPTTTAAVLLDDVARLSTEGEHVVVVGAAGAVGAAVCQLALRTGARVTGLVSRESRLAELPPGVEGVVLSEAPAEWAKSRPFTLLADTVGGPDLIARTRWVQQGGRAVVVGYVAGTDTTVDLPNWLLDDVALLPINMIRKERRAREVAPELITLLASGDLTVAVEKVPLAEAADALHRLANGQVAGRVVVEF